MLTIGTPSEPEDLVGLLLACHERIRRFAGIAVEIGHRDDLPPAEIASAAQRCEKYFDLALPLHVADEEESLLPRLRGVDPDLDAALEAMGAQHREHAILLPELLAALRAVQVSPEDAGARERLRKVATPLARDFEQHLELEERVVFPAILARLSAEAQAQAIAELRARRGGSTGPPLG
jgi:hemerythrin-like domain-containing protein